MAKAIITSSALRVELGKLEALAALQPSFEIPLTKVRGATEDTNYISAGIGFRSPGTGFPGLIAKGTFRSKGQKLLSIWSKGQQLVVIELIDSKWDRILIGCSDAKQLANQINRALSLP